MLSVGATIMGAVEKHLGKDRFLHTVQFSPHNQVKGSERSCLKQLVTHGPSQQCVKESAPHPCLQVNTLLRVRDANLKYIPVTWEVACISLIQDISPAWFKFCSISSWTLLTLVKIYVGC